MSRRRAPVQDPTPRTGVAIVHLEEADEAPDLDTRARILRKAAHREERHGNVRRAEVLRRMALDLAVPPRDGS